MEESFNTLGTKIYTEGRHECFYVKWSKISGFVRKWSGNRDSDDKRITEIYDYYINGGHIPRMIHLAELSDDKDKGLICYDGNHRREVFDKLNDGNLVCIVDVIFHATQEEVFESFKNINKSIQLPALYTEQTIDTKNEILGLVKKYEYRYKNFLSASNNPKRPNFNRDGFAANINDIYEYFKYKKTINDIEELLEKLNEKYSKQDHPKASIKTIEKCKKHNFWLFINEKNISCSALENM